MATRFYNLRTLALAACILAALVLTGCAPPIPRPAPPEITVTVPAGATRYAIDQGASTLEIAVYRGGPLAHLGHNHVISAPHIEGSLWRHPQLAKSGFALWMAVDSLVVDDSEARTGAQTWAGAGFDTQISEDARRATRRNMLGPAVLDSAGHPWVLLNSVTLVQRGGQLQVTANLTLRGQTRKITFTAAFSEAGDRLRASGEFSVRQSDFGITPYSVALGALRVEDEVRVRFELTAVAE